MHGGNWKLIVALGATAVLCWLLWQSPAGSELAEPFCGQMARWVNR